MVDEPQPVLREGQRDDRRPLPRHQRFQPARALGDAGRELGDGGRLEDDAHRQLGLQRGVDRGDQAHGGQRVAAEVEERVVDADPFDAEDSGIDAGQDLLDGGARGAVSVAALVVRGGQGAGVELAVDRHRQRVEHHHRRGDHVGREALRHRGACAGGFRGPGDVTHQAFVAGPVLAGDDDRLLDPVERGQRGLDLAEFDAVAADLDLFVGAAQVAQLPLPGSGAAPADQVAGAVHAGAGFAEGAGHESGRGQPGAPPIAHAHTFAGQIQLPDHPGGHRAQPLVEHEERRPRHR
ncbi:hypothetical protein MyChFU_31750 [Mycobacterium intracellulare subsp. chimaera]